MSALTLTIARLRADAEGRPVRGGSYNVDLDATRVRDILAYHTAPIGD